MRAINDGGPAFPMPSGKEPRVNETTHYNEGMTLRDYLAAAAMQGFISKSGLQGDYRELAITSYLVADEMLRTRSATEVARQRHTGAGDAAM